MGAKKRVPKRYSQKSDAYYYTDSYDVTDTEQKRLTENNLVSEGGVYANKIQLVWFLLVKYTGESYYHSAVATDEFVVPAAGARS